ncbi:hypothetical protein BJ508DRAFT_90164 [Ascobolus immersus RN42]|uniref:Uncharacterized protein n=1 Tax=Ascobolus immersus RN42 TaxID=1160509 RepID=A0A3N4HAE3_ASCIM|nr:hypothetical protein BJ508DRAFT_90164 [Ascobolus immersus RN42]
MWGKRQIERLAKVLCSLVDMLGNDDVFIGLCTGQPPVPEEAQAYLLRKVKPLLLADSNIYEKLEGFGSDCVQWLHFHFTEQGCDTCMARTGMEEFYYALYTYMHRRSQIKRGDAYVTYLDRMKKKEKKEKKKQRLLKSRQLAEECRRIMEEIALEDAREQDAREQDAREQDAREQDAGEQDAGEQMDKWLESFQKADSPEWKSTQAKILQTMLRKFRKSLEEAKDQPEAPVADVPVDEEEVIRTVGHPVDGSVDKSHDTQTDEQLKDGPADKKEIVDSETDGHSEGGLEIQAVESLNDEVINKKEEVKVDDDAVGVLDVIIVNTDGDPLESNPPLVAVGGRDSDDREYKGDLKPSSKAGFAVIIKKEPGSATSTGTAIRQGRRAKRKMSPVTGTEAPRGKLRSAGHGKV